MFRKQQGKSKPSFHISLLIPPKIHPYTTESMVYKWNYSKDKINQAGKKAVKPGAGRKPML
jgi:hypothetical protein